MTYRLSAAVGILSISLALASCGRPTKLDEMRADCQRSVANLVAKPFLPPLAGAHVLHKKCISVGEGPSEYYAPVITYDFHTINPSFLKDLRLAVDTQGVIFVMQQLYPARPVYRVLVTGPAIQIQQSGNAAGDITLKRVNGLSLDIQARLAIVDSLTAPKDSTVFWWDSNNAANSVGAALIDPNDVQCPDALNCRAAAPPSWPFDPTRYPRRIFANVSGFTWLAFDLPSVGTNVYKYWLRAFGHGLQYDVDPKIKNQPV